MSVNLGGGGGLFAALTASDDRACIKIQQYMNARVQTEPFADGLLWSRSRVMLGGNGYMGIDAEFSGRYEPDTIDCTGGAQIKKIIGATQDQYGNPLGSCTVDGFVTATNQYVGRVVSDSSGYFELPTAYSGQAHYLVAYQPGSPDVSGTTVNTLMPA